MCWKMYPRILFGIFISFFPFAVRSTEIPFCSGRSQVVTLSSPNSLVLDGSNSLLYNYIPVAAQPGTTCKCSIVPTATVQTMTVTLKSTLNIEYCTKNLRVVLRDVYYYDTVSCTSQAYTMESVGTSTIEISLGLMNLTTIRTERDETYQVSVESATRTADTEFRVTCYSPTIGFSSTSKKPTTPSSLSTASPTVSTTSSPTATTMADQTGSGDSKTVLIVCLIVACGVLMMSITICVLCCIARRVTKKEVEKHQRSPRRIYRRICHTIRTLPRSFNLRRPLPTPPDSSVKVTKLKPRVSAVDSGPYDSIKSSIKSIETVLNGTTNGHLATNGHLDTQNEYGYIYPIYNKDKQDKKISPLAIENPDKYLTPLQDRPATKNANTEETTSLDSDYVNASLAVRTDEDLIDQNMNMDMSTGQYIEMRNARKGQNDTPSASDTNNTTNDDISNESQTSCRDNQKRNVLKRQSIQDLYMEMDNNGTGQNGPAEIDSLPNETSVNINNVIQDLTQLKRQSAHDTYVDMDSSVSNELLDNNEDFSIVNGSNNHHLENDITDSKTVLKRESTQDHYMEMDHLSENKPNINKQEGLENEKGDQSTENKSNIRNREGLENEKVDVHSINNDYMTMNEIDNGENKVKKESVKDKTFPNLMKFHVASIKPKLQITKKRPPPVKPKPVKYVREMPVDK